MFKKIILLLTIFGVGGCFASSYRVSERDIQIIDKLHKTSGLSEDFLYKSSNSFDEIILETGRLEACFLIEEKLNLPRSDDSTYINDNKRKLEQFEPLEQASMEIDKVFKNTLQQIADGNSQFKTAAQLCLEDLKLGIE